MLGQVAETCKQNKCQGEAHKNKCWRMEQPTKKSSKATSFLQSPLISSSKSTAEYFRNWIMNLYIYFQLEIISFRTNSFTWSSLCSPMLGLRSTTSLPFVVNTCFTEIFVLRVRIYFSFFIYLKIDKLIHVRYFKK